MTLSCGWRGAISAIGLVCALGCGDDPASGGSDGGTRLDGGGDASTCELPEGESRCLDGEVQICLDGRERQRPCPAGTLCRDGGCECDLVDDGLCPDGCAEDSDCQACTPQCLGRTCGSDGCGGDCGRCTDAEYCGEGSCISIPVGTLCSATCEYAGDGECDDGGEGSLFSVCELGTDCADCGPRLPPPPPPTDAGVGSDAGSSFDAGAPFDAGPPFDAGAPRDSGPADAGVRCLVRYCEADQYCVLARDECLDPARYSVEFAPSGSRTSTVFSDDRVDPSASTRTSRSALQCSAGATSLSTQVKHTSAGGAEFFLTTRLGDWNRATGYGTVTQVQYVDADAGAIYDLDPTDADCEIVALPNTPDPGALVVSTRCTVVNAVDGSRGEIMFDAYCTAPL